MFCFDIDSHQSAACIVLTNVREGVALKRLYYRPNKGDTIARNEKIRQIL